MNIEQYEFSMQKGVQMTDSVDPDQTASLGQSDLDLHCFFCLLAFLDICFILRFSGIQHFKHYLKYCERDLF